MLQAIRERVIVKAGGTVEVRNAALPEGAAAEVIVMIEDQQGEPPPLASLIGKGKGCFANAAEIDAFIRAERDAWER